MPMMPIEYVVGIARMMHYLLLSHVVENHEIRFDVFIRDANK